MPSNRRDANHRPERMAGAARILLKTRDGRYDVHQTGIRRQRAAREVKVLED